MSDYLERNYLWQQEDLRSLLATQKVIIGGMGGLGWIVGSSLVNLGVKNLKIFDADRVQIENFNRLWGCNLDDIGSFKVEIFKSLSEGISNEIKVQTFPHKIPSSEFEDSVSHSDVVFGCFDNPASRVATQILTTKHRTTYIDSGTSIRLKDNHEIIGKGQVFISNIMDTSCIVCSGLRMTEMDYNGISGPDPSSGVLNSIVGNIAVSQWVKILRKESVSTITAFDWKNYSTQTFEKLPRSSDCPICGNNPAWKYTIDFSATC